MVKKIINWTAGGFFRSLGRILMYVVIGLLLSLLLSKSGFKLPSFFQLDLVNAASITSSSDTYLTQWCSNMNCDYTLSGSTYYTDFVNKDTSYVNSNNYYLTTIRFREQFNSSNYLQSGTQYTIRYRVNFNPKYDLNYYSLSNWQYYLNVINTSNAATDVTNVTCSFSNINNDNYGFYVTCLYTPNATLKQISLRIEFPYYLYVSQQGYSGYIFKSLYSINYKGSSITYSTGVQDSVENQTTLIQEQTTMINDSINNFIDVQTDTDVDSDSSDMADFINDFELETDGTISQILTIPIDFISDVFLTDSSSDLCFTLRGVQSCLPNGKRVLWNKDFSGCNDNQLVCGNNTLRDSFKNLFNLVVGGFICYKLLIGLAKTIERALQPADTYVEVMKL